MHNLDLVTAHVYNNPWIVTSDMHDTISEVVKDHIHGNPTEQQIQDRFKEKVYGIEQVMMVDSQGQQVLPYVQKFNGQAIVRIHGPLMNRASLMQQSSGMVSYQKATQSVNALLEDDKIKRVIFDVDSPGGSVSGVLELSNAIYKLAQAKETITYGNGVMASGALWIGVQTGKTIINELTTIGSLGVVYGLMDRSQLYKDKGVKPVYITSGKYKALGRDGLEISKEDIAKVQESVDEVHKVFVEHVAQGMGLTPAQVEERYGDSATYVGQKAIENGLADELGDYSTLGIPTNSIGQGQESEIAKRVESKIMIPNSAVNLTETQPVISDIGNNVLKEVTMVDDATTTESAVIAQLRSELATANQELANSKAGARTDVLTEQVKSLQADYDRVSASHTQLETQIKANDAQIQVMGYLATLEVPQGFPKDEQFVNTVCSVSVTAHNAGSDAMEAAKANVDSQIKLFEHGQRSAATTKVTSQAVQDGITTSSFVPSQEPRVVQIRSVKPDEVVQGTPDALNIAALEGTRI